MVFTFHVFPTRHCYFIHRPKTISSHIGFAWPVGITGRQEKNETDGRFEFLFWYYSPSHVAKAAGVGNKDTWQSTGALVIRTVLRIKRGFMYSFTSRGVFFVVELSGVLRRDFDPTLFLYKIDINYTARVRVSVGGMVYGSLAQFTGFFCRHFPSVSTI